MEISRLRPQAIRRLLVRMDDTTETPPLWHGKIRAALARAERATFTRPGRSPRGPR